MKPAVDAIQRPRVGFSPRIGDREHHGDDGCEEADGRAFRQRQVAQPPEEAHRGTHQAERAQELQPQVARAPEVAAAAVPRDRRHDHHLAGIAGPHDEDQRVVAHEVLRGRVERAEEEPGEEDEGEGAAEGRGALHGAM